MAAFEKGHKKLGGRTEGTRNRAMDSSKNALNAFLPEHELAALWKRFLQHKDPHIAFEAFKLANYYMFGKPVTIVSGGEEPPPIKIEISAIPKFRVPAAKLP